MELCQLSYFIVLSRLQSDFAINIVERTFTKISVAQTYQVIERAVADSVVFQALVAHSQFQNQHLCFSYTIFV